MKGSFELECHACRTLITPNLDRSRSVDPPRFPSLSPQPGQDLIVEIEAANVRLCLDNGLLRYSSIRIGCSKFRSGILSHSAERSRHAATNTASP